jgi:hypothetical protein
MKTSKTVIAMLFVSLLVASAMSVNIRSSRGSSGAVIWMNPPELTVSAGSTFGVDIVVNTSTISQLTSFFDVFIHFNPSAVQGLGGGGGGGGGAYPPFTTMSYTVDNTTGAVEVLGEFTPGVPPSDNVKLAYATFVCVQSGSTILDPTASSLFDPGHAPIVPIQYAVAVITQTTPPPMYYKPSYPDYAPSGMPDFDEKQNALTTKAGQYTWCVPVAVADSLWWLDSKYESINFTNPVPPPAKSDHFNLVTNYSNWDDHDPQNVIPLVVNLAILMDTDNLTSHDGHMGTRLTDIQSGIQKYLVQQGVASLFEVHNSSFPTFAWIDNETELYQDVELCLEFWQQTAAGWIQPTFSEASLNHGHCVVCAGSNSTTSQVSICDPYQDAFEAGLAPGRSPALHAYPHNSSVHNDAQFVSQDTFAVSLFDFSKLPFPQPPGYNSTAYELQNYLLTIPGTNPSYHAFIRLAVATSPTGVHDVAATNVTSAKTIIGKGYGGNLTETAQNKGNFDENFNVTTYANSTAIAVMNFNLSSGNSDSKICVWNTTGYGYGNYTLTGSADVVPGETNVGDNNYTCGIPVHVGVPGDVSSTTPGVYDKVVNMKDIAYLVTLFNTKPGSPNWNPNADVNNDGVCNMKDIAIAVLNFSQHE